MDFLPRTGRGAEGISLAGIVAFLLVFIAMGGRVSAQGRPLGRVTIRVADERESGIATADVRLYRFGHGDYSHRGFTDGNGIIDFPNVGEGDFVLEVHANGYEAHQERIDVAPGMSQGYSVTLRAEPNVHASAAANPGARISKEALSIPKSARKEFQEGLKQLQANAPAQGARHFENAIKQYPKYAEAYAWLGMAYLEEKRHDEAVAKLQKAIGLDPKLSVAHTMLGKLYLEDRDFSHAEPELLKSLELDPKGWDASLELSRCYFNMNKLDQALEYAKRANASPQAPPITHLLLVDVYLRRRDKANALRELQEFAKADPQSSLMPQVKEKIEQLSKPN